MIGYEKKNGFASRTISWAKMIEVYESNSGAEHHLSEIQCLFVHCTMLHMYINCS